MCLKQFLIFATCNLLALWSRTLQSILALLKLGQISGKLVFFCYFKLWLTLHQWVRMDFVESCPFLDNGDSLLPICLYIFPSEFLFQTILLRI